MKKVVVGFVLLAFIILIGSLSFPFNYTGNAVASGSSGTTSSGKSLKEGVCGQAPFDSDPGAKKCGNGCCFSTQTCYKNQVCCGPGETGDGLLGIVTYCKKKCDASKGQTQCGEICCEKGETCKTQGLDLPGFDPKEHGTCFKADQIPACNVAKGETTCPPGGEVKECCAANQVCKVKKLGISFPPIKISIWGCSVDPKKNGGCGADTFCGGTGKEFKDYAVCCKKDKEVCALHPNGQPYCHSPFSKTVAIAGPGFFERVRGFFRWS
ncbi:MAG: hypothetical protein AABY00_00450 [Nanoarchaeota archaeon]